MGKKTIFTAAFMVLFSPALFSQQKDTVRVKLNHYSFNIGTGWIHYINNLEYGDKDIQKDFAGISLKFFWEPEYLISLGLETGYYKLFKVELPTGTDTSSQIDRSVVPLLLLVRMRIVDNVYLGAGMGIAIITNKTSGAGQEIVTKTNSLANFELSAGYIYPLSKHWRVGGEFKAFHFGSLNDWMYSVQALCAFRL